MTDECKKARITQLKECIAKVSDHLEFRARCDAADRDVIAAYEKEIAELQKPPEPVSALSLLRGRTFEFCVEWECAAGRFGFPVPKLVGPPTGAQNDAAQARAIPVKGVSLCVSDGVVALSAEFDDQRYLRDEADMRHAQEIVDKFRARMLGVSFTVNVARACVGFDAVFKPLKSIEPVRRALAELR